MINTAKPMALLQLIRFDRPIGTLLLLWPTLWALWIAAEGVPDIDLLRFDFSDQTGEPLREVNSTGGYPHKQQVVSAALRFDDFVRDALERPIDVGLGEDGTRHSLHPFPPHRTL